MSGAIWRNTLPTVLEQNLPGDMKNQTMSIFGSIVVAKSYPMGSPARDAINVSYIQSQRYLAIAALSALAPMLIIMWFLENVKLVDKATLVESPRHHDDADHLEAVPKEVNERDSVEKTVKESLRLGSGRRRQR